MIAKVKATEILVEANTLTKRPKRFFNVHKNVIAKIFSCFKSVYSSIQLVDQFCEKYNFQSDSNFGTEFSIPSAKLAI